MIKQLLTYFTLAYLISWIIWLPMYGHVLGFTNLPTIPFNHAFGALGPLFASFLTTWIYSEKNGVKRLAKSCVQVKPFFYFIIAIISPFCLVILAAIGSHLIDKTPIQLSGLLITNEFPNFSFLTFLVYNLIFFGFGEETGWRGFALPRLQVKYNALIASCILTAFWALWHWPLFLYRPGYVTMSIIDIFGWLFSLLTGSILLAWLYNSSRGSVLICAIFHSTIDVAFTADLSDKNIVKYTGFLVTVWGILVLIILKSKNLATTERTREFEV
ncbi:MAG: family intrarane metalloprotease [Bacteroidota bacterium]|jgi:membrane protease YdiL (CAAX protease family)|nr:family intrarane metalloprotease [Bacteroidota bacterium]